MTDQTVHQRSSTDPKNVPTPFWWGLGFGVLAFVVHISSSSSRRVNGVLTECSYTDYFAFIAAAACVGFGVVGLVKGLRASRDRSVHPVVLLALALVLAILAVVHVLRGIGMIGGPC
ncbi:hypothetical protein [Janibacter corallicola]|uniref:hypothetical protein n=1 Tax=Janibacter corallicola TaxID=415212 RepID=UPI00083642BF|nr:hypothetical protein [Janibacter corallicola]